MTIPLNLEGEEFWFQLDTGADISMLYGTKIAKKFDRPISESKSLKYALLSGSIAKFNITDFKFYIHDSNSEDEIVGTIGLDIFLGRSLVIDFEDQKFCVQNYLPERFKAATSFVPAEIRRGKFFPELDIDGSKNRSIFFDTGSSGFDVWVDKKIWEQWGDQSIKPTIYTGSSWGKDQNWIGVPMKKELRIGKCMAKDSKVFYREDKPDMFAKWPHKTIGLLGNRPFYKTWIVLDAGKVPKFGTGPCK